MPTLLLAVLAGCRSPSHALAPLFAVSSTASVEQGYHLSHCPKKRYHLYLTQYFTASNSDNFIICANNRLYRQEDKDDSSSTHSEMAIY
jgi:hypothetical protein